MSAPDVIGKFCPICAQRIAPGTAVVVCDGCQYPYHADCYNFNGGCATLGCTGSAGQPFFPEGAEQDAGIPKDLSGLLETYCPACSKRLLVDMAFCPYCGARAGQAAPAQMAAVVATQVAPPSPVAAAVQQTGYRPERPTATVDEPPIAGFGSRLGAWILDTILLIVAQAIIANTLVIRVTPVFSGFLGFLYFGIIQGATGQSAGKAMVGIKIIRVDGTPLGVGKGLLRWLCTGISGLILGIGYLMAAWTTWHQALHDQIVGTIVIRVR